MNPTHNDFQILNDLSNISQNPLVKYYAKAYALTLLSQQPKTLVHPSLLHLLAIWPAHQPPRQGT